MAGGKVRFGVIGCGNMGSAHAKMISQTKSRDFCLAAVADLNKALAEATAQANKAQAFDCGYAMMDSGLVDAVIIAVPHYFHTPLALYAAKKGLHVLVEKPVAVTVGEARMVVAECRKRKVAMGVMFQNRNVPSMHKMKQLVAAGAIGEIYRAQMICSNWYRTQFYYDSGAWRGTWDGEGGGILLNQAPHSLDLFQWIAGMPKRIIATVTTRDHRIAVENTANAILDYGNGRTGYIFATTADAPGMNTFTVAGDKGTLVADGNNSLRMAKLAVPLKKHLLSAKSGFEQPACKWVDVPLKPHSASHIEVTKAFVAHILRGTPMVAEGVEGINELELSNAIYLSGFTGKPVELPLKGPEMEKLIDGLIRKHGIGKGGNLRKKAQAETKAVRK